MKTIRVWSQDKIAVIAFSLGLVSYGKIFDRYRLEFKPDFGLSGIGVPLYLGKKKPLFRNLLLINLFVFPLAVISTMFLLIYWFLFSYFEGAKNFFIDGVWQTNVKFFNYCNIIWMLIFLVLYLTKQ